MNYRRTGLYGNFSAHSQPIEPARRAVRHRATIRRARRPPLSEPLPLGYA